MKTHFKFRAFAFSMALFLLLFFPFTRFNFFIPFLVLSFYKTTRYKMLWRAFLCGLITDLITSSPFFGFTVLNLVIVCFFLYRFKFHFFEDKFSTLPLLTTFFSFVSTCTSLLLLFFSGQRTHFSWRWCLTDLIGFSLIDGLYAVLFYSLPFQLTPKFKIMWRKVRLFYTKRLSNTG